MKLMVPVTRTRTFLVALLILSFVVYRDFGTLNTLEPFPNAQTLKLNIIVGSLRQALVCKPTYAQLARTVGSHSSNEFLLTLNLPNQKIRNPLMRSLRRSLQPTMPHWDLCLVIRSANITTSPSSTRI